MASAGRARAPPRRGALTLSHLVQFDRRVRLREGVARLGGLDEAGRGPLAGPVVAAAVVIEPGTRLGGVDDSKRLTAEARDALAPAIVRAAAAYGLGMASAAEIDRFNILRATHMAARRALDALPQPPEFLITDYLQLEGAPCPLMAIARGDATSAAVAAASILAKVARDRIMAALDREYPGYGFARHKGYGTAAHLAALAERGPSAIHRFSFNGVCWFDAAPAVRSIAQREGRIPAARPPADWKSILAGEPFSTAAFLPQSEYETPAIEPAQAVSRMK